MKPKSNTFLLLSGVFGSIVSVLVLLGLVLSMIGLSAVPSIIDQFQESFIICLGHLPLFNAAFTEANTTGLPSDIMAKHIDKQVRLLHTAVLTCRPMSAK